jgi:hypothetical protein
MNDKEKLTKIVTELAIITEELFKTDPFIIGEAVVDYLNTVDPHENKWSITDFGFEEKGTGVKVKEYPLLSQEGYIGFDKIPDGKLTKGILGIQVATDGRVWVCINGNSLLRFRPKLKGGD